MERRLTKPVVTVVVIVALLGAAIFYGAYHLLKRTEPFALGEHCMVATPDGTLDLDIEQAQVAATIAAVAVRRKLPERALQIAYVTAIQESKLANLPYGDRDSVGVFQQRPSMGWGTPKQLQDPVYAARKFFAALEKVRHYTTLPLHEAAQAVQRSADGSAYADHEYNARILSAAFIGRVPQAVHCWYPPSDKPVTPQPEAARKQLVRALGTDSSTKRGWLIAAWYVTHAQKYGLRQVRYEGVTWTATSGHDGWRKATKPVATVQVA